MVKIQFGEKVWKSKNKDGTMRIFRIYKNGEYIISFGVLSNSQIIYFTDSNKRIQIVPRDEDNNV